MGGMTISKRVYNLWCNWTIRKAKVIGEKNAVFTIDDLMSAFADGYKHGMEDKVPEKPKE